MSEKSYAKGKSNISASSYEVSPNEPYEGNDVLGIPKQYIYDHFQEKTKYISEKSYSKGKRNIAASSYEVSPNEPYEGNDVSGIPKQYIYNHFQEKPKYMSEKSYSKGKSNITTSSYEVSPNEPYKGNEGYETSSDNLKQFEVIYEKIDSERLYSNISERCGKSKTNDRQSHFIHPSTSQETYEVYDNKSKKFITVKKVTPIEQVNDSAKTPKSLICNKSDEKAMNKLFNPGKGIGVGAGHQSKNDPHQEWIYEVWNDDTKRFDRICDSNHDTYTYPLIYEECSDPTKSFKHRI